MANTMYVIPKIEAYTKC